MEIKVFWGVLGFSKPKYWADLRKCENQQMLPLICTDNLYQHIIIMMTEQFLLDVLLFNCAFACLQIFIQNCATETDFNFENWLLCFASRVRFMANGPASSCQETKSGYQSTKHAACESFLFQFWVKANDVMLYWNLQPAILSVTGWSVILTKFKTRR